MEQTAHVVTAAAHPGAPGAEAKVPSRLVSLDALRGATIALMVLVNNSGGPVSYRQLEHSEWNGWTITDTVFPTFLWIVGVAITLSLGKRIAAGVPKGKLVAQIFRRAALLYVLGLLVYVAPAFSLSTQRVLGVLQRIAICYLIASLIYLYTSRRAQIFWIIGLFAAYWMAMTLIPVPGFGRGHLDLQGNFAHYVDNLLLGRHNYSATRTWDPEGIVSTIPAICTALLGVMAGHTLRLKTALTERIGWLLVIGNILMACGMICEAWLPINKKLWTDSFSLFMAGLDFVLLGIFAWFIDHRGHQRWIKPLLIMGMNAITVYLASEWLAEALDLIRLKSFAAPPAPPTISLQNWIYSHTFLAIASPINASLLYAITFVAVMYLIAYVFYKRGWFLRV